MIVIQRVTKTQSQTQKTQHPDSDGTSGTNCCLLMILTAGLSSSRMNCEADGAVLSNLQTMHLQIVESFQNSL